MGPDWIEIFNKRKHCFFKILSELFYYCIKKLFYFILYSIILFFDERICKRIWAVPTNKRLRGRPKSLNFLFIEMHNSNKSSKCNISSNDRIRLAENYTMVAFY